MADLAIAVMSFIFMCAVGFAGIHILLVPFVFVKDLIESLIANFS